MKNYTQTEDGSVQLCRSRVLDSEFDDLINDMLPTHVFNVIMVEVMQQCGGHENIDIPLHATGYIN